MSQVRLYNIIMRGNMVYLPSCVVYSISPVYTIDCCEMLFAVLPGELSRWEGCDERGLHGHLHRGRGSVPLEWVSGHPAKIPSQSAACQVGFKCSVSRGRYTLKPYY